MGELKIAKFNRDIGEIGIKTKTFEHPLNKDLNKEKVIKLNVPVDITGYDYRNIIIEDINGNEHNLFDVICQLLNEGVNSKPGFSSRDTELLNKVDRTIRDNLHNPEFSIGVLCEGLGMSRSCLLLKIKKLTGDSIIGYIKSIRLKLAIDLIRTGRYTIKEVAYKVGFNDSHYFSRAFKNQFGLIPSYYLP